MKKFITLVLSIVFVCSFSVTAFAAESPVANEKVTITIRKANIVEPDYKLDTEYTVDAGTTITVKADPKYGKFNSWSVYKEEATVEGTSTTFASGIVALSAVKNLAAKIDFVKAVKGVDYEIVKGSLTTSEMTIKLNTAVIVCGNYDNVVTDPSKPSKIDDSETSAPTGDMTVAYIAIVMLAAVAFAFGTKKVYSK